MIVGNKAKEKNTLSITIRNKRGQTKYQWQDNFIWRFIRIKTGKDIRIPVITGYPTKLYKTNIK